MPYPAYKFSSIQSVAIPYVGLISEAHLAIIRLSPSHQFGHLYTWPIIWLSVGTKLDNIPCDGLLMP